MTSPSKNSSPISEARIEQYNRDGYLLVSGLIPEDIAAKAEAAMWRCAGIDSNNPPSSWDTSKEESVYIIAWISSTASPRNASPQQHS